MSNHFWCPIRFYDGKKCDNCKQDFPDLEHGWTRADGTMSEVVANMEEKYGDGHQGMVWASGAVDGEGERGLKGGGALSRKWLWWRRWRC